MLLDKHQLHVSPGRLVFGPGSLAKLPEILKPGLKYIVVTDKGLVEAGVAARVEAVLTEGGVDYLLYDGITPDPPIACVERGVELAKAQGCNGVIGLGGGSALDAAKGLALRLVDERSLRAFGDGIEVTEPVAPFYAVPTTAGTGSEATRGAVISDPDKVEKMSVRGEPLIPAASVLDPELMAGMPSRIAAECGADALTHAIEAYTSRDANIITDCLAAEAIRLVGENLRQFTAHPGNLEAGENMMLASFLAGEAFTNGGLGLVHSLAEVVGAKYHVSHGLACALYLPPVMSYNLIAVPEKFAAIAALLGEEVEGLPEMEAAWLGVEAVEKLFDDCGLPATLSAAEFKFEYLEGMAEEVMPFGCTLQDPRRAAVEDVKRLYLVPV